MTRSIALLGSTGSIGRQTLEVARELGLSVAALTANKSVDLIEQQAREFCPRLAVLYDEDAANELRARLSDTNTQVLSGMEGLLAAATADEADTGVTAVIQSSSATSAMVVGFVNSGMMKLSQAIGIVLGANIGTSVTGWILCLSYISSSDALSLLSSATITAIAAIAGILLRMLGKTSQKRHTGDILLGFAVLMYGMNAMSGAVSPLRESEAFIRLLTTFSNPLIGILVGAVFTSVLQSASAAVGILQALSMTGAVSFSAAYPIILGIAIGAAVPVLLSSLGAKVDGKRTALAYLVIEIIGVVLRG